MSTQLRKLWQFFTTYDLLKLGKSGELAEAGAEVTKLALEFGIALGLLSAVAIPAGIAVPVLSGVGLAIRGVRLYREKTTGQEPSLEEWVAIAAPLAYLDSLNELVKSNDVLRQNSSISISEVVKQQIEQLGNFQLDEQLAKNALSSFHESELGQALNKLLVTQLIQAGIAQSQAQIFTAWVAWGTHRYMEPALAEAGESVRQLAELYGTGRRREPDKYDSIDDYLKEQIATKPLEKVFAESFTFRDIYVPLKAKSVDKNGDVDEDVEAFDLETWAKDILNHPQKQDQVMFIQGGPGRGKSVFCRMFADWVRQHLHPIWTPILIRLRDIRTFEKNFENTLRSAVKADFASSDDGWLTDRNTHFLFLLDGFDELLMEGRTSGGLEQFLKQVGQFQRDCQRSPEMGHQVLITGRSLALQSIERLMPSNLERVEIQPMDNELQQLWLNKWSTLIDSDKASAFQQFLQNKSCPEKVREELAREPLLLYLLAAMHRDGELKIEDFLGTSGTQAKILIYEKSLDWVLTEQRPDWLNREITEQDTEDLRRILTEAGLCVIQSSGECASVAMIEERLKGDNSAKALLEEAQKRIGDNPLRNALATFYLQQGSKEGSVEFAHKSFSEFLCAERLKESIIDWTRPGIKRSHEFYISTEQMDWEIYDLLGYGGLTPEIVEYLMGLLTVSDEFRPVELFKRLESYYLRWCDGEFIDAALETLPQKKMRQLREQGMQLGLRQVDVYAGLNVMILLLKLNRYAQARDDLKDKMSFYPCGQKDTENFNPLRLLRIIGYSDAVVGFGTFLETVGIFFSDANLSGANLSGANLSGANLSDASLSRANLSRVNLSRANLSDASLSDASLSRANLSRANLNDANLSDANLSRANLNDANLSRANLSDANLSRASLSHAYLSDANLSGVNLSSAYLSDANLSGANLSDANLSGANLSHAYLSGANLSRANLSDAYLSGANLSGANLVNVSWNEYTKWEGVQGLESVADMLEALKKQLGLG